LGGAHAPASLEGVLWFGRKIESTIDAPKSQSPNGRVVFTHIYTHY